MEATPKWYMPVAITALLWNLAGCAAYLADAMLTPEDIAAMSEALQEVYAIRPSWAVAATAIAVWGGAAGSVGLIMKKRWATPLLVASLAGIVVQDVWLFVLSDAGAASGAGAYAMQGVVLVVGIALVLLGRKATANQWIS